MLARWQLSGGHMQRGRDPQVQRRAGVVVVVVVVRLGGGQGCLVKGLKTPRAMRSG